MFIPNVPAVISRATGRFDASGNVLLGADENVRVGLVKLQAGTKKSMQNDNGSASGGANDEATIVAVILLEPSVTVSKGDKIAVSGMTVRVESIWPDYDTSGRFDHWEVEGSAWVA